MVVQYPMYIKLDKLDKLDKLEVNIKLLDAVEKEYVLVN